MRNVKVRGETVVHLAAGQSAVLEAASLSLRQADLGDEWRRWEDAAALASGYLPPPPPPPPSGERPPGG